MVYLKLFLMAVFWGGTFIAGKAVAGHVGPYSAAFLRFVVATVILFPVAIRIDRQFRIPEKKHWFPLLLLGMTGVFAYNAFFFNGLALIEASRASLIVANNPIIISLFSAILFHEKLTRMKIFGILLSVSGAMVVITRGDLLAIANGGIGLGEIYIFGCVASWVTYSLIGKVIMKDLTPLTAVAWSSGIGAVALLIPALREGMTGDMAAYRLIDWASLCYMGVFGTVLSFVWYYQGIRAIGPIKAGQFINFVPVSAIVLAIFILKEPVTVSLMTGAAMVICGVFLTNRAAVS